MRRLLALTALVTLALALSSCGGDDDSTSDDGASAPSAAAGTEQQAETDGAEGSGSAETDDQDPVVAALEFCSSNSGTKLEVAGTELNEAAFPTSGSLQPRVARVEDLTEQIMQLSEGAPPASDCAINAVEMAAGAWKSMNPAPPNASEQLKALREFQRDHEQTVADVLQG